MRYVLYAAAALAVIVLAVVVTGYALPAKHRATGEARFSATPDVLFALLTDRGDFPRWRSDVQRVEPLPPANGHERYREIGKNGTITYSVEEVVPGRRLVTRIDDRSLPFGGTWTYELVPDGPSATTLRITEDGEVYNPVFRFMSRFVFGHTATIDAFLSDAGKKLSRPR